MSFQCRLCGHVIMTPVLSLGRIPVCNGFAKTASAGRSVKLDVAECEICSFVQLGQAPSVADLIPRVPWIRYREPEGHLDAVASEIFSLRRNASSMIGAGPFDAPLMSRMATRGIDARALELGVATAPGLYPYLESWQASLTDGRLVDAANGVGTANIVSCRYIVEHSPAPVETLRALGRLLSPDGLLVIEVPDSSKFLKARDYCFLWEEHSCYFVAETLQLLAMMAGFHVVKILRYPGVLEDSLIAFLEVADAAQAPLHLPTQGTSEIFQIYRDGFRRDRDVLQKRLAKAAGPERDRVALIGVGHHAIMFMNAFGVADLISLALDDDPDKIGFIPPGFHKPVAKSARLLDDEQIQTCLFAMPPQTAKRVCEKLAPLAERGVEFHSIYAGLDNSILREDDP